MEPSKRVNRLAGETSPYLLQHAHNPVDWFPWSPEALDKARREDKPIFLSIGYSACHWCHVMAHESFENEDTARLMNEWFVNVKVDREERPDLDSVYMKAVVAMTGQGGWPLNAFLTPDLEPYFGGTYFPPASSQGRPGFPRVLKQAYDLYRDDKAQVKSRAGDVLLRLDPEKGGRKVADAAWEKVADESVAVMAEKFDETHGGFGSGMKFPEPMVYSLLLRHWLRTHSSESLAMVDKSLTKMAEGGIFDQLGGGFHRYSADPQWRVPHFEKMLDDNALMARLYFDAFQATKQELYSVTASEVLGYVLREMISPEGAFYSSQDADAGGAEGRYYVWDLKEVLDLLGPRNAKVFARAFGVSPAGAFGGRNVLCVKDSLDRISAEEDIPIFEVHHIVKTGKQALLERRALRAKPGRDEKILTAWNGLTIAALATGHSVLRNEAWLEAAVRCAAFLWDSLWDGERLLRVYKDGRARIDGFLDDYACLTEGFIALYDASFDAVWIDRAVLLAGRMIDLFWDDRDGGFFMSGKYHEKLIARPKNPADEAGPSANAVAALALLRLGWLTGRKEFSEKGEGTVKAFQSQMETRPAAHNGLLSAADFLSNPCLEIVIAGPRHGPEFEEMLRVVHRDYRPNKILVYVGESGEDPRRPQSISSVGQYRRPGSSGTLAVYVCQDRTCHPPVQTASALSNLLEPPPLIKLNLYDEEKHAAEKTAQETDNFLNAMSRIFKYSGLGGGKP